MIEQDVVIEMQRWAEFQRMRHQRPERVEDAPGDHPLSRARQFAPGTRAAAAKLLASRDGRGRRRIMAQAAGGAAVGMELSPMWASDAIRCKGDPSFGPGVSSVDRGMPPGYEWIDRGLRQLRQTHPVRAIVLHTEFTVNASQLVRARIAAEEYGGCLSKWQYRRELALGLSYMCNQGA